MEPNTHKADVGLANGLVVLLVAIAIGNASIGLSVPRSDTVALAASDGPRDFAGVPASSEPLRVAIAANDTFVGRCDPEVSVDVGFQANVTGGTPPYLYSWNFGDGSANSKLPSPVHTYRVWGLSTVNLTVTDAAGSTAVASTTFEVHPPPCPIRVSPLNPLILLAVVVAFLLFIFVLARRKSGGGRAS